MGEKVAGTAYIKSDGEQFDVTGNAEAPLMDVKRESILPGFYKEEDLVPYIQMECLFTKGFPLKKLKDSVDQTVTLELQNGRVYVLTGGYVVGEPAANSDEGKVTLRWEGRKGVWQ